MPEVILNLGHWVKVLGVGGRGDLLAVHEQEATVVLVGLLAQRSEEFCCVFVHVQVVTNVHVVLLSFKFAGNVLFLTGDFGILKLNGLYFYFVAEFILTEDFGILN